MDDSKEIRTYIYTYACRDDELSLCLLEQRSLFGAESHSMILKSPLPIEPSRSPFITGRLDVIYEAHDLQDMIQQVAGIKLMGATFKIVMDKRYSVDHEGLKIDFKKRREIERELGLSIDGEPDLFQPKCVYGLLIIGDQWYFGLYTPTEAVWLRHMKKPQSYSTALSTRVARAVVNIAVPHPEGKRVIDPCCGIGTVLIEALSMGIDIVGRDFNPLVVQGARENIKHFELSGEVTLGAIQHVKSSYDAAIIDMPYNLFSVITPDEQRSMLKSAARIADRVIIITIEELDSMIEGAGLVIIDRCVAKKGLFVRHVIVCESMRSYIQDER